MKTIFILNKASGNSAKHSALVSLINKTAQELNADVEIYFTKAEKDATFFIKNQCTLNSKTRFIVCGGDGTLNEAINGVIGFDDAEVGIMPYGTGNDFCRNFDSSYDFLNVAAQLTGSTEKCDVIKYKTTIDGTENVGYCVNMFNIGFDCNVADLGSSLSRKTFITGSMAYFLSILIVLIKKKGADLKIELDGMLVHQGPLLLTSIANGCFCGGGIKSNPYAKINDGIINANIIYNISRINFLSKLPFYMKGTHINLKNIEKVIKNYDCKNIVITPKNKNLLISVDGEILTVEKTEFNIIHNAFNLVMPKKYSPIEIPSYELI